MIYFKVAATVTNDSQQEHIVSKNGGVTLSTFLIFKRSYGQLQAMIRRHICMITRLSTIAVHAYIHCSISMHSRAYLHHLLYISLILLCPLLSILQGEGCCTP